MPFRFRLAENSFRCVIGRLLSHALFCICREGYLVARAHGLLGPRDSPLSEMSSFEFLSFTASASSELSTRDHRIKVTVQSTRHGASEIKQAVRTDACGFGATPPRSASMSTPLPPPGIVARLYRTALSHSCTVKYSRAGPGRQADINRTPHPDGVGLPPLRPPGGWCTGAGRACA